MEVATPRTRWLPEWIESTLDIKADRDPLGLQTITQDQAMPMLVPGILALSRRARYFSFYPFLLREYQKRQLPPTNQHLSEFMKRRELDLAVARESRHLRICSSSPSARVVEMTANARGQPGVKRSPSTAFH